MCRCCVCYPISILQVVKLFNRLLPSFATHLAKVLTTQAAGERKNKSVFVRRLSFNVMVLTASMLSHHYRHSLGEIQGTSGVEPVDAFIKSMPSVSHISVRPPLCPANASRQEAKSGNQWSPEDRL